MNAMRAIAALLALAACTAQTVRVRPSELALRAPDIVKNGEADIWPLETHRHVRASDAIDVHIADGDTQRPQRLTIGELVAGCVVDVKSPDCLAHKAVDDLTYVRTERHLDKDKLATGIAFTAIGGAIGACLVACQDNAELGKGLEYMGIGVAAFAALFILLVAAGGRD